MVCTPASAAEPTHAALPNSELAMFEESGHFPCFEEQELFVETVGGWLDRLG